MIVDPQTVLDSGLTWGPDVEGMEKGLKAYSYDARLVAAAIVRLTEQAKRIADLLDPKVKTKAEEEKRDVAIWDIKIDTLYSFISRVGLPGRAYLAIRKLLLSELDGIQTSGLSLPEIKAKYDECLAAFVFPGSISKPGTKPHADYAAWYTGVFATKEQDK